MPKFKFIEENHTYWLDDIQIPSVTQVLPYNFFGNDSEYNKDRGSKVHKMIELYNMKNLDEESLDPILIPYLQGYKKFVAENGTPKNCIIDIKTGTPQPAVPLQLAGYALLIEEAFTLENEKFTDYHNNENYFELSLAHPIYRFAGTIDLVTINNKPQINCYALYLNEKGLYKIENHTKGLRHNKQIFLSFLTTFKWKIFNNLLDK